MLTWGSGGGGMGGVYYSFPGPRNEEVKWPSHEHINSCPLHSMHFSLYITCTLVDRKLGIGLLADTQNYGLCMRLEFWERFHRHQLQRKPLVSDHACAVKHVGIANPRWRGKRFRNSRRMCNPQFYVSDKRPMWQLMAWKGHGYRSGPYNLWEC